MNVYEFDFNLFEKLPVTAKSKRKHEDGKSYVNCVCAFDIETTQLDDIKQAIMYLWAIQIGEGVTIYGRTWEELRYFIEEAEKVLKPLDRWLVLYTHNLSYEFQFLRGIYRFENSEVFAIEPRKILTCTMCGCIEFRCSYLLTDLSLRDFLRQMGVENQKKDLDYSVQRFPWDELPEEVIEYMTNDVKGLVQAITKKMNIEGDDVLTIPLTKTGYVRKEVREALRNYYYLLKDMKLNLNVYKLLAKAFRGGNCTANRWYVGQIVENVDSWDMVSAYPAVMLEELFPSSHFVKVSDTTEEKFRRLYDLKRYALLGVFRFHGLRIKNDDMGTAYLNVAKCKINYKLKYFATEDRIYKAEELETTLTDIDFRIVEDLYEWDSFEILELWRANYAPLPNELKKLILKYYDTKTTLRCDENSPNYVYYILAKERINSIFGLMVQDPLKRHINFIGDEYRKEERNDEEYLSKLSVWRPPFQWGVWVSAYCRLRLYQACKLCGRQFIYCDTDSVKFVGEVDFGELNKELEQKAEKASALSVDENGVIVPIGVFKHEADYEKPNRFKTLGAKQYVLEKSDGVLKCTIAGVQKQKAGDELKSLESFDPGFTFVNAGGTESIYNDNANILYMKDGHTLVVGSNVYIHNIPYTIKDSSSDLEELIENFDDILRGWHG